MSQNLPYLISFRVSAEEGEVIDGILEAMYPGVKRGTALRSLFTSPVVVEFAGRRHLAAQAAAALLGRNGGCAEPLPTPTPHPALL